MPAFKMLTSLSAWIRRLGKKPKIGLALGSGAALGVAHIGVLSVIQELNIPISYLSGCSSGSFVGALYAGGVVGKSLEQCGRDYNWRDAGRLHYFPKMGLATNDKMALYLERQIDNPRFEDLRVPFYVSTTNLNLGEIRYFHKGPVIPTVRASCVLPGIFSPVEIEGDLYCDGGILTRIPCKVLKEAGADLVIAVDLHSPGPKKTPQNIFEVMKIAFDIAQRDEDQTELQSADLIIRPDLDGIDEFGFNQNDLLIERGRQAALNQLSQWPHGQTIPLQPQTKPAV